MMNISATQTNKTMKKKSLLLIIIQRTTKTPDSNILVFFKFENLKLNDSPRGEVNLYNNSEQTAELHPSGTQHMRSPTNSPHYQGILIQKKSTFKTNKPQQYTIRFWLFSPHTPTRTHTPKSFPVIVFQPRLLVLFVHRLISSASPTPFTLPLLSAGLTTLCVQLTLSALWVSVSKPALLCICVWQNIFSGPDALASPAWSVTHTMSVLSNTRRTGIACLCKRH